MWRLLLITRFGIRSRHRYSPRRLNGVDIPTGFIFVIVGIVCSIPMGLVFILDVPVLLAYIVVVAAGTVFLFSVKVMSVAMATFIQGETPTTLIGKVLSVLMVVPFIGQSIGYPIIGRLFQHYAESPWLIIFSSVFLMMIVAIFAYRYFKKAMGLQAKRKK